MENKSIDYGIHFNMPDEVYFGLPALGSTDMPTLAFTPADWWWKSKYNPKKKPETDESIKARAFGSALHKYILEGLEAFNAIVVQRPSEFKDWRSKEAQKWREEQKSIGKIVLDEEQIWACQHMGELLKNHPDLALSLDKGLKELAVIWQEDNITYRAKFDNIIPSFSIDIKSFAVGGVSNKELSRNAVDKIVKLGYDIQAAHYDVAREKLREFVRSGQIFGGNQDQHDMLTRIADKDDWLWTWLFFQKLDNAKGKAPSVLPLVVKRDSIIFRTGREKRDVAIKNYKGFVNKYGFETPWAELHQIIELQDHDFPVWLDNAPMPQFNEESEN